MIHSSNEEGLLAFRKFHCFLGLLAMRRRRNQSIDLRLNSSRPRSVPTTHVNYQHGKLNPQSEAMIDLSNFGTPENNSLRVAGLINRTLFIGRQFFPTIMPHGVGGILSVDITGTA